MGIYCGPAPILLEDIPELNYSKDYWVPSNNEVLIPSYCEYCENSELEIDKLQFIGRSRVDGNCIFKRKLADGRIIILNIDSYGDVRIINNLEDHIPIWYDGIWSSGFTSAWFPATLNTGQTYATSGLTYCGSVSVLDNGLFTSHSSGGGSFLME